MHQIVISWLIRVWNLELIEREFYLKLPVGQINVFEMHAKAIRLIVEALGLVPGVLYIGERVDGEVGISETLVEWPKLCGILLDSLQLGQTRLLEREDILFEIGFGLCVQLRICGDYRNL